MFDMLGELYLIKAFFLNKKALHIFPIKEDVKSFLFEEKISNLIYLKN